MSRVALLLSVPVMAWGLCQALVLAPREKEMGDIQRIFYVHLPCAWIGLLSFLLVALFSALHLFTGSEANDRRAQASAELGVLFTTLVLITGPLWAKPVWGAYWTWDARLTSTFVMWLLYIGYLMLRANALDPVRIRRVLAVYGIVAFLDVPFVYFSIYWFRTLHPKPVVGPRGGGLDPAMWRAVFTCFAAFLLLYVDLLARRTRVLSMQSDLHELRAASAPA